jgi:hypothetical protein
MDGRYYGFQTSTDITESGLEIGRVYLAADSFEVGRLSSYREIAWEKHAS